jgi:hypothetical protein
MSEFRVWSSILGWAAFALLAAWGGYRAVLWFNPDPSFGILLFVPALAVQAAYGVREIARRFGWARKSYAPTESLQR